MASYARSAALRRLKHERIAAEGEPGQSCTLKIEDNLSIIVHSEIDRLPERYRRPIILCCVEGYSREQAAPRARWPLGTRYKAAWRTGRKRLQASLLFGEDRRACGCRIDRCTLVGCARSGAPESHSSRGSHGGMVGGGASLCICRSRTVFLT